MNKSYEVHIIKVRSFEFVNYCYLIVDKESKTAAIIDPAWEFDTIKSLIEELKVKLTTILITHCHFDHVNRVDNFTKEYNPQVYISAAEANYYDYSCYNMIKINDIDTIKLGNTKIIAMITPGHTKGSVCYLLDSSIFTGDTVFTEGCGICTTEGGSAEEMFYSIQRIKENVPKYIEVFPGHSYGIEVGQTMEYLFNNNLYFAFSEKENFINFRMRKKQKNLFKFQ